VVQKAVHTENELAKEERTSADTKINPKKTGKRRSSGLLWDLPVSARKRPENSRLVKFCREPKKWVPHPNWVKGNLC